MRLACLSARVKANYIYFINLRKSNFVLDYGSLSALAAVVREGSFERAARTLHVTPATWFAPAMTAFAAEALVLMDVAVDDQDHTSGWLRNGVVLAAVTANARPAPGCNSRPLGAMRYLAAATPAFVERHFPEGVGAGSLSHAPSLVFNTKDELQARWARRQCHRHVELPKHALPSPQAFVTAALAGMGWGLHPQALIAPYLKNGSLVELIPDTSLDVPLHWQQARAAMDVMDGLTRQVLAAARMALIQDTPKAELVSAS
jgi:LysR family transcriptional regulator (chromosome initiation inhibitor)